MNVVVWSIFILLVVVWAALIVTVLPDVQHSLDAIETLRAIVQETPTP